jgi:hypothetical protein
MGDTCCTGTLIRKLARISGDCLWKAITSPSLSFELISANRTGNSRLTVGGLPTSRTDRDAWRFTSKLSRTRRADSSFRFRRLAGALRPQRARAVLCGA